jgi:aspartyl/asparaginyl beta-hydroxylase (cupin superfamily)
MFAKLKPNGQVYPHVDAGAYYALRHRFHLVIQSRGSLMKCGGEEVVMNEGELWAFDNKKQHEAFNESADSRIHLIFDLLVDAPL